MIKKCKDCGKKKKIIGLGFCGTCYIRDYRKRNPNSVKESYQRRKEKVLRDAKVYYKENKEEYNKRCTNYQNKKYKDDSAFRELILFRHRTVNLIPLDGKSCVNCGSTENLNRHHLSYDDPTNIIILCRKCHNLVHKTKNIRD